MKAIVLAGGFGTRLQSVVKDVPKPMAPVLNRPFLSWIFDQLLKEGISEVVLSIHHKFEVIQNFFGEKYTSLNIKYALEDTPLGTGGAILNALRYLDSREPFFVLNGDSYFDISLRGMVQLLPGHDIVVAVRKVKNCERYGQAIIEDKKLLSFQYPGNKEEGWINGGIYLLKNDIFDILHLKGRFSFEKEVLENGIKELSCFPIKLYGSFIDIGIPEDYVKAPQFFKKLQKARP